MKKNNGHSTKRITIVVPESTEVIDITYYWKTQFGNGKDRSGINGYKL